MDEGPLHSSSFTNLAVIAQHNGNLRDAERYLEEAAYLHLGKGIRPKSAGDSISIKILCIPEEFHGRLKDKLTSLGVSPSEIELVVPDNLSAEHFRQSPAWRYDEEAVTLSSIIRKICEIN